MAAHTAQRVRAALSLFSLCLVHTQLLSKDETQQQRGSALLRSQIPQPALACLELKCRALYRMRASAGGARVPALLTCPALRTRAPLVWSATL